MFLFEIVIVITLLCFAIKGEFNRRKEEEEIYQMAKKTML